MGLEITRKDELNQYEVINHKSSIRLWLHDVLDGLIKPGLITIETLFVAIAENINESMAELYAPIDHEHTGEIAWSDVTDKPDTYPPEAHEHPEYEGGSADARIKMWVGTGATSSNPHIVFDTAFNKAGFMLLRFPYSTYRFTVWGPKPNDPDNCYAQDTSTGGTTASYSDRLSSSGLGVFGAWDSANSMYVCFLI